MLQDFRLGLRMLVKSPGFSFVAVLVLALGIGVNAAIFSIVNAVLFRPLPVSAPEELRYVYSISSLERVPFGISYPEYLDLRDNNEVFAGLLGRSGISGSLTTTGEAAFAVGEAVSGNYFELLGIRPAMGRAILPEDDRPDTSSPVMVLSDGAWKRRFRSDPNVIGKQACVDWKCFTIVGVAGPEFNGTGNPWSTMEYWIPLLQHKDIDLYSGYLANRSALWISAIGRLKPGISGMQARAFIEAKALQFQKSYPYAYKRRTLTLLEARRISVPFDPSGRIIPERLALALMTIVGALLLIAAANVAGILSARGVARGGEIAIRLALGARRPRLVRQLLTESLLLALLGGVFGLCLARILLALFIAGTPSQFWNRQLLVSVPLDFRVFLFTALICVATGVLTGLVPAIRASKINVLSILAGGGSPSAKRVRTRLRHWIIVPQFCLTFALLVLAGIFLKIVLKAELAETGYETDRVAFVNFGWKADFALQKMIRTDYSRMSPSQREAISAQVRAAIQRNKERSERFNRTVLGRSQSLPGVTAFALTSSLPITLPQRLGSTLIDREAYLQGDRTGHGAHRALVSAGYFQVMNVPLLAGRLFDEHDQNLTRPVAVVSDLLARWTWPGENPIGQHFTFYSSGSPNAEPEWVEVVGVVGEVTSVLSEGAAQPFVYVPLEQEQQMLYPVSYLLARGHGNPAGLIVSLQKLVTEADDNIQIMRSRTMNEAISELLYAQRMASAILGTSGLIGLLLACVGLYGVVSYSVARRTREFGIRTAVGAGRSDILRLVIREGTLAAWIGAVLGLLLSITAIRMISHYVVAIPGLEPVSLVAVPLLLGGTVLLACYIPARRAARVDPIVALREL